MNHRCAAFAALAAVLIATAAPAQQGATPRPAAPAVQVGQKSNFFTASDGIKIHYLTHGDRGSWVMLIHGYSDSAQRMWFNTGIAPEIAKRHRVVAIDNRNHGQSDKPIPGGSGRAQDVIELMDHLKIDRAHIHGYSMGGGIVGQLLALIPNRFITARSEEHTSELQSQSNLVCRLLLERAGHPRYLPSFPTRRSSDLIDNRNHGQSDKPIPGGSGRAQDVIELMDHLKIDRAHIHGYSMGGGIVGQLLALIPNRFITA